LTRTTSAASSKASASPVTFPFNSIESVVLLGESTLGVAIDNNYPGDTGRRAGVPDDSEFIRIDFAQPLSSFSTAP
jgi:hypothetical protein